ncbi:MAG: sensor histidine kinase [Acidimicrobiales bacterium]
MSVKDRLVDQIKASSAELADLDDEEVQVISLLDSEAALKSAAASIPDLTGMDTAFVGSLEHGDLSHVVLRLAKSGLRWRSGRSRHPMDGLVVPSGLGLGGLVQVTGHPQGVTDYCRASSITHDFDAEVSEAGLRGMLVVPVLDVDRSLGVLYGASRHRTHFGGRKMGIMVDVAARAAAAARVAERARHAAEVAVHEERRRLAVEMHDTLGAMLFSIGANARKLEDETGIPLELRQRLAVITLQAAEAGDTLRRSLQALHTPAEALALDVALHADCRAFEERTGIPARLIDLTGVVPLPPARTQALVDAVREALLNVQKHASARSVAVTVAVRRGFVTVTVADDGHGLCLRSGERELQPRAAARSGGLGVRAATERLERVGGGMSVTDNEDVGVTCRAWVPE